MINYLLDPIERREMMAESTYSDMQQPNEKLKCCCGRVFDPSEEGETLTPDPYAIPVCATCAQQYFIQLELRQIL